MKKTYFKMLSSLLITTLLIAGCKKEIRETNLENDLQTAEARGNHKNECRLISNTSEFGEETFTYNRRGLLDEWYISGYNGYFKQEYNARGRLVKSRFYVDNVLVNTIVFFYHNDRVVKEIWYNGDTKQKTDEVFYHYNWRGLVRKTESIMGDYSTIYQYTRDGNVLSWIFYIAGSPVYSSEYTYLHRHKNPFSARPGVEYGFPYINGGYDQNKWYSTSEKAIFYDENGNPVVYVDQDPYKTIVQANRRNYVTASDFFDVLTQEYVHFRFEYENCGRDDRDNVQPVQKLAPVGNRKINPMKFIKKGSAKSIKEQVKELRRQMKENKSRKK